VVESEESEVSTEGTGEDTGPETMPAGGMGVGKSPGEEGAASLAPTRVSRALLLEPVEEKYTPHRIPDMEREKGARSGSLAYADGFPRVMGPLTRGSGDDKEKMVAGKGLLAWKGGDRDNSSTGSPSIRESNIERMPGCGSVMDSRVVKIAKGGERRREGGKTEAAPPMKAVMKAKPASL
jgi:hypothetical protein